MYKLLGFCVFIGGLIFGWSVDVQLSATEKMNIVFPPSAEVKIAFEDIESLAQITKIAPPQTFSDIYKEKLTLRSYTCIKNLTIGRFDSLRAVRKLPVDVSCLAYEDNKLLQYLRMSQVAIRLSQPPLRPQIQLGQKKLLQQPSNWITSSVTFSSKSGVAVLANGNVSGEFISYDIKAGRRIAKLESIFEADINKISLSPNGRVVAIPTNRGGVSETIFLDAETGSILARLDETMGVRVWLPKLSVAILKHGTDNTLLLADFKNSKTESYEIDSKAQNWALDFGDSSSRVLVGTYKAFHLVQIERVGSGVKSTTIKDLYPPRGSYISYSEPILMLNSRVAIFNFNDLFQYDLDTGKETRIETQLFFASKYEKLDEERFLVKASSSINLGELVVFNIKDKTLSHINEVYESSGALTALNGRNGFLLKQSNRLWAGENLEVNQSKTLQTLLAEKQAKLIAEKARDEREIALFGVSVEDEPRPESPSPMPIQRDYITGEFVQDAYGRPIQKDNPAQVQLIKSKFFTSKIPENTRYEFIGVKESANTVSKEIQVTVQKSDRPIFLVLSSCNTVKWKIKKQPGSRLFGVFQQIRYVGQPFSSVALDDTEYSTEQILRGNFCAYERDSTEYKALEREILEKDNKKIEKFQSAVSGVAFSVGN